jgi:hypothetical protein
MPQSDKVFVFRDATSLTRWAKRLLYAGIVLSAIGIVSSMMEYQLLSTMLSGTFKSEAELIEAAAASDRRQQVIGIVQIVLFLVTGIVVLMWIYRANNNAHALGADSMRFTPGWAVGWYFIPIFNLWKPYQAMTEIWKASADPHHWQDQQRPSLLPWWWFLWITSAILGQVVFRIGLWAKEVDELMKVSLLTITADIIDIPLSLVLIAIIGRIFQMQMGHHAITPIGDDAKIAQPAPTAALN